MWLAAVATTAALMHGLIGAHGASAGTYVMRNCDVPGHPYSPLAPWDGSEGAPKTVMVEACAAGGGVGFRFAGAQQLRYGEGPVLTLRRPPTGAQSQIKLVKVSLWYAARLGGTGQPLRLYSLDSYSDNITAIPWMITGAPGAENLSFEQQLSPANTHAYRVFLACGPISPPAPPDPCIADHPMPLQVRGMEVTLSEDVAPLILRPVGTLLSDGPQSGIRTLTYAAADAQSGVAKVTVLLDDVVVAIDDLTTRCFHSDFTACPASHDETLRVDTRAVPNGSHALTVRVEDAAGNERVVQGDHLIEVANQSSSDVTAPYALSARFTGASRSTLTVPYGRRVSVRGRLTRTTGSVAVGTPIEVLERLDRRGARERFARKVITKVDGSFSTGLATNRPSRSVRLAYRPTPDTQVVSPTLKLRVRAASTVRASLRGRIVRFSGRVLSRPVPRAGKRVVMEGRSPGSAWTAFRALRTDREGRFSGTYRLRVRRPGIRLKVRAIVPREKGYGYLGSRSRTVTFRVR